MDVFKKNLNLRIIVCFVIGFNLIAHTLWSNYFCTAGTTKLPDITNSIKTGNISTILTGSTVIAKPKLSTKPKTIETTTSGEVETTTQEGTKLVLVKPGQVSAGYDGETTYERVRNQMIKLGLSYEIAEHITWEAYANTEDHKLFVKNIIGVSNSESGIFKHCSQNNCFGVMVKKYTNGLFDGYTLKKYDSIKASISDWRAMYNRNKRYLRTTGQDWLDGHYCTSACTYRISNYNYALSNLGL